MRQLAPWVAIAFALVAPSAQAYVQTDVVTLAAPGTTVFPTPYDNYVLHFGSRPATVGINYDGSQISFITASADADIKLRLTTPGEALTAETFALPEPAYGPNGLSLASVNSKDFYLAGMVTTGPRDPGEPAWDMLTSPVVQRFGWAHFVVNDLGQLTVKDSAMAYVEQGIIAGTTQAIPEPGTYALMGIGLVGMACLRKTRKA